ncbi:MAG: hypothetical protein OEW11_07845 [Nitrospirota bacterium]|nr:hypothetical protein [Nitrospirota bacterium]
MALTHVLRAAAETDRARPATALRPAVNGAVAHYDFATGTQWGPALAMTRASTALGQKADGKWYPFSVNVLRTRTDRGALFELATTNLNTNYNAPTLSSSTAAYTTTGTALVDNQSNPGGVATVMDPAIGTHEVRLRGGASGGTVTIAGAAGAGAHSFQMYARLGVAPNATVDLGGKGAQTISNSNYTRIKSENIAATAGDKITFTLPIGSEVAFVLNSLETGAVCHSPVVVAGAAATRLGDQLILPSDGVMDGRDFSVVTEIYTENLSMPSPGILLVAGDPSNWRACRVWGAANPGRVGLGVGSVPGTGVNLVGSTPITLSTPTRLAYTFRDGDFRVFRSGVQDGVDAWGTVNALPPASVSIGWNGIAGGAQAEGWIKFLTIYPLALAPEQAKWLTA